MKYNALLAGVGGEGVLLASVVLSRAAAIEGYEVRGTQLHGLAQRGGSIPAHVRFGHGIYSPLIARGEADMLLGLEPMEAARYCYFASKERTSFIVDTYPVIPYLAQLRGEKYPDTESIRKMIEPFAKKVIMIDASNICARGLGNPVYGNIMCLGVAFASAMLPLRQSSLTEAIKQTVPRGIEQNMKAFRLGLDWKG